MIVQFFQVHRQLPDICPSGRAGVMRWPNGDVWIPEPTPPQQSGLFGRTNHDDWERHAMAAAAQVRALARSHPNCQRDTVSRCEVTAPWQRGYDAAGHDAHERGEQRRVLDRLGIEVQHIPDPPGPTRTSSSASRERTVELMSYTATISDPNEPDAMAMWESFDHPSDAAAYRAAEGYVRSTQPGDRIVTEGDGVYSIWSAGDTAARAHVATLVIAPADQ
jgi:hypothetical protein